MQSCSATVCRVYSKWMLTTLLPCGMSFGFSGGPISFSDGTLADVRGTTDRNMVHELSSGILLAVTILQRGASFLFL